MIDLVSHYETKEMVFKNINVGKRWFNKVYKQYDLDNYTGINYNHKVVEVEWLTERINTYNMEVDNKNHNYLLGNGLVIKNSTLAAEDLRFSRTIERIQKIVVSELTKIAIIHLYSQGYKNKDLLDFELILSNPSVVHDEMKIELWNSKVSLARDMLDTNLLSSNFVYEQIFKLNQDDAETERLGVLEDKKRAFRYGSIEQEGSDPANQTPNKDDDGDEDDGFKWEDNSDNDDGNDSHETSGSSKKENSKIDTMLGVDDMKDAHKYDKNVINHKYKGGSALSLESIEADVFDENDEEINANKSLIQKRIADKYNFLERLDATLQYAKKESDKNLIKEVLKMKKIK